MLFRESEALCKTGIFQFTKMFRSIIIVIQKLVFMVKIFFCNNILVIAIFCVVGFFLNLVEKYSA